MDKAKESLDKFASLCMLEIPQSEREEFARGFDEIAAFADMVSDSIVGDAYSLKVSSFALPCEKLREDIPARSLPAEKLLGGATSEDGFFLVGRVIK